MSRVSVQVQREESPLINGNSLANWLLERSTSVIFEQEGEFSTAWVFRRPIGAALLQSHVRLAKGVSVRDFFCWVDEVSDSMDCSVPFCAGYVAYEAFEALGILDRVSSTKPCRVDTYSQDVGEFVLYQSVIKVVGNMMTEYKLSFQDLPSWIKPFSNVDYEPHGSAFELHLQPHLQTLSSRELETAVVEKVVEQFSKTNRADHVARCDAIKEMIRNGDVYQVNISLRLDMPWSVSRLSFESLVREFLTLNGAPRRTFVSLPPKNDKAHLLVSASPELFFSRSTQRIACKPIKGTRPSYENATLDQKAKESLLSSSKDRAELAMIVDLVRNDLNRVCETGSVKVERHFELKSYAAVYHTVSEITGTISEHVGSSELFCSLFPSGSVTGAPKMAAIEAIAALEPHKRDCYCGAIGYFAGQRHAHFNVGIRTLRLQEGVASTWAGSGVTIDSDSNQEFDEALVKLIPTLRLLAQACY